jgi:hypothetical protein
MKFSIRWFLLFTGWAALVMFAVAQTMKPGPPASVLRAAQQQVPGMVIKTVRPETFNGKPAWEVHVPDPRGEWWLLDVSPDGEMLMYERYP